MNNCWISRCSTNKMVDRESGGENKNEEGAVRGIYLFLCITYLRERNMRESHQ